MERYIMQDNCYRVYLLENDWSDCTHLKMYSVEQKFVLYLLVSKVQNREIYLISGPTTGDCSCREKV